MELQKTYDPKKVEDRWYAFWEEQGFFHADVDPGNDVTALDKLNCLPFFLLVIWLQTRDAFRLNWRRRMKNDDRRQLALRILRREQIPIGKDAAFDLIADVFALEGW